LALYKLLTYLLIWYHHFGVKIN